MYDGDIASTLVTERAIQDKIAELAEQIGNDYAELCENGSVCCSSACSRVR